ncbi:hypothetical protein FRZ06_08490 [Anoxybacterium hadale]|uniref:Uncharacterized protein n=1 Tax=Anoxybacterium hadale TaxID=3408580 RepID=A0ACD1AAI9_9FIRM|nr:hypothetical protein FRZ06_08490 [Clostridiales bacterium]
MRTKGISRSQLFLIELIVVVLFFSLAAAMVMMAFGKAHELSAGSEALNGAISAIQSTAETDKGKQPEEVSQGTESAYYDKSWKKTDPASAEYLLNTEVKLEARPAGFMAVYRYAASYASENTNTIIYKLEMKKYYSGSSYTISAGEVN